MDRLEFLIQKLINGETIENWECLERLEEFLVGIINKTDITYLGEPLSRYEELLIALHTAIINGGSGENAKIISPSGDVILSGNYKGDSLDLVNQGKFNLKDLIIKAKHIPLELNVNVPIPEGYVKPEGNINISDTNIKDVTNYETAKIVDNNLIPENIIEGKSILGVVGNAVKPQDKVEIKDTNIVDVKRFAEAQVVDANLISSNIKKGVSILGVTGSAETGVFETWEFTMEDGSVITKQALIKEGA